MDFSLILKIPATVRKVMREQKITKISKLKRDVITSLKLNGTVMAVMVHLRITVRRSTGMDFLY